MVREAFSNNVRTLCNNSGLSFYREEDDIIIKTDFESFAFNLVGQDVLLIERRVRGAGNFPAKRFDVLLVDPNPKDIVEAVFNNASIKNDDQYSTWYYERVKEECKSYNNMVCELKLGMIFLKTNAEEFHIKFDINNHDNVILMHRGKMGVGRMRGKTSYEYHRQFTRSISPRNIVKYIYEHTQYKYF